MEKYTNLRKQIKTGDIILYRGKGIVSRLIQKFDNNAYYNHTGIAYWIGERLFTVDAWTNGVQLIPMSRRMNMYLDFCVIRKNNPTIPLLRTGMNNLLNRVEISEKYGYFALLKRLLYLKDHWFFNFLFKLKILSLQDGQNDDRPVCSDVSRDFAKDYGATCYDKVNLPSPEDLRRYADKQQFTILFDDAPPAEIVN